MFLDRIHIHGLRVFAWHGVNPEEKENGQWFELDIVLETDLRAAGRSDALCDTVSYAAVTKRVLSVMTERSYDLLEAAAAAVARTILEEFPVESTTVVLKKPQAPMKAEFAYMAVEITRRRGEPL